MLDFVKTSIAKGFLGQLADNHDTKTTILGLIAGALVAQQTGLDFGKLLHGDGSEIGKAVGVVVAVLIGYYTNKPNGPRA